MPRSSIEQVGEDLYTRLCARRPEVEEAVLTRVLSVHDASGALDSDYAEGLRGAVGAALDYGLGSIQLGGERFPSSPPPALLAQARMAARNGVGLDTVLRHYVAGHALVADFLVEEAEAMGLRSGDLQRLLRAQAALLDRLLTVVGVEHARESEDQPSSAEQRDAKRIERLLAGELLDTTRIAYDFEAHHIAAIAKGPGAGEAIRALAAPLDRRLLVIERKDDTAWAWLGGRRQIDPLELQGVEPPSTGVLLALGEPAQGLSGWRLTHRQARAALPIAMRSPKSLIRYAEVALLASIFQDDLLSTSLHSLYLAPLEQDRDGGKVARETLRAYFATDRNISSAAAVLGVSRRTVANRLRAIEGHLDHPLAACTAEMEAALRLHDLDRPRDAG